jgi:uncharacterized membrane protein YraQ (UPF0718 family)
MKLLRPVIFTAIFAALTWDSIHYYVGTGVGLGILAGLLLLGTLASFIGERNV